MRLFILADPGHLYPPRPVHYRVGALRCAFLRFIVHVPTLTSRLYLRSIPIPTQSTCQSSLSHPRASKPSPRGMNETEPSRVFRVAARFLPTIQTPTSSGLPSQVGSVCLLIASITLTYRSRLATALRVLLFAPILYCGYYITYGDHPIPNRPVSMGMTVLGLFGIMKAFDICLVSLLDSQPPMWIHEGKQVPLPTTLVGRIAYGFDLVSRNVVTFNNKLMLVKFSTVRGASWFSGHSWDWAPKFVASYTPGTKSRTAWFARSFGLLAFYYVVSDVFDTINHSREWSPFDQHPVTMLLMPQQLLFSFSLCVCTLLGIAIPITIYSIIFVALGSSPASWAPMFDHPFAATSLQDFWTRRWHHIFRRVFDRMVLPFMVLLPKSTPPSVRRVVRAVIIFGFSASFHLVLVERMLTTPTNATSLTKNLHGDGKARPVWAFIDSSTLQFFLYQPVGLFIERIILTPVANRFPGSSRIFIHRMWVWVWLLWTGRFWADAWVRGGMWAEDEGYVGWSPLRGVLFGQWWRV